VPARSGRSPNGSRHTVASLLTALFPSTVPVSLSVCCILPPVSPVNQEMPSHSTCRWPVLTARRLRYQALCRGSIRTQLRQSRTLQSLHHRHPPNLATPVTGYAHRVLPRQSALLHTLLWQAPRFSSIRPKMRTSRGAETWHSSRGATPSSSYVASVACANGLGPCILLQPIATTSPGLVGEEVRRCAMERPWAAEGNLPAVSAVTAPHPRQALESGSLLR
jgi:O-antigen ligase